MVFKAYGPDDLLDLAERRSRDAVVAACGDRTGVALPDWVHAGLVLSTEDARRLGAQLLIACDEHDAIQNAAFGLGDEPEDFDLARDADDHTALRDALKRSGDLANDGRGGDSYSVLWTAVRTFLDTRS